MGDAMQAGGAIDALLAHCEVRSARTMEPRKSEWLRRAAAVRALAGWREAVIDAAVVGWTYRAEHETDPRAAINALLAHAQQIALDPAVSTEAAALHQRIAALREAIESIADCTSYSIDSHAAWHDAVGRAEKALARDDARRTE